MSQTMRFPIGFEVRVRDDVRRLGGPDGRLLVGGSPIRALRLAPAAGRRIVDGRVRVTDAVSDALAGRLVDANIADPVLDPPAGPVSAAPTERGADLTVVVPVRDRPEQLDRCLAPLRGLRVLVVDDASLEPSAVAKVAADHGAEVLPLTVNVGPASARNAGLAQVRTPYVAFVDSDVVADAAMLVRLARHLADARVALVGPLVRSRAVARRSGGRPRWFERYDEEVSSLALGTRACSVEPGAAVGWLPSACLVGRVAALRDHPIGGFTEGLRVGEDVDLVWRLVGAGHRVRYDPAEVAHHDARTTVRDWLGRKLVYGTGGAPLAARHGRHGAPAVLTVTGAAAAAAVLVRRRWSWPIAAAGVGYGWWQLDRRLPEAPDDPGARRLLAGRLAAQGLGWAIRQESALLLRHWWPLTALLLPSRTVRRAVVTALLVDTVLAEVEHPGAPYQLLARRLDDLAYGAGLWLGALRARSAACLLPRRPGRR
ncbi:mycofactocin biosynthesis glycosyltransferase MftF [Nocardioides sp. DS6]|uniref:Mycofactocin biosynthesis glycosyltransferase MftF n=1 Tax=Nocardioides eburneus TaxID=3231482 RepID=A0ABV3SVT2_9ACTN